MHGWLQPKWEDMSSFPKKTPQIAPSTTLFSLVLIDRCNQHHLLDSWPHSVDENISVEGSIESLPTIPNPQITPLPAVDSPTKSQKAQMRAAAAPKSPRGVQHCRCLGESWCAACALFLDLEALTPVSGKVRCLTQSQAKAA